MSGRVPLQAASPSEPASQPSSDGEGRFANGNLVSNAVRHTIVGGRIEVATRTEAGHAVLALANTGRIVPAAVLARLFEPFRRLNSNPRTFR